MNRKSLGKRSSVAHDKPVSKGRHEFHCTICSHPQRDEIDEAFVNWGKPSRLATKYSLSRDSIYRHAHALGLIDKRRRNVRAAKQGLNPVAPFPYKPWPKGSRKIDFEGLRQEFDHDFTEDDPPDYLDVVMGYLMSSKELNIPKTREMMTSWLVVGFITWFCQFFEKIGWIGQSEDDLKAQGLIKYANILYSNQEQWMKDLHPLKRRKDEGTLHKIEWENGSWFLALPSGVRKLASQHPHGYFNDESAHQPAWKETVNIVRPAVRQIINVSSVAPGHFADECLAVE